MIIIFILVVNIVCVFLSIFLAFKESKNSKQAYNLLDKITVMTNIQVNKMVEIKEITINEFEETIYDKYATLFPEDEQRSWDKITNTYNIGVEKFYKITNKNETIGFCVIERINDTYPYYLDYFAIFKEYQNKGFGTEAIKRLIEEIGDNELILEVEKVTEKELTTVKRAKFYKILGFKEVPSEYLVYNVLFTPYIYTKSIDIDKNRIDKIMFDYYKINVGINNVRKNCKIIK